MTDLMPMMDAYKICLSNMAKLAEANGAELNYTNENAYENSVTQWYVTYVQAKHNPSKEEGEYDEYIEVINDIMIEIMNRLTIDEHGKAWMPENVKLFNDDDFEYGYFHLRGMLKTEGQLTIAITSEVQTKKGNPFFDFAPAEDQGPAVLKCPTEVIQILEDSGIAIEVNPDGSHRFEIDTPFLANELQES